MERGHLGANDITIRVGSTDNTGPDLDALKARLNALAAKTATARVAVDDKDGQHQIDLINAKLAQVGAKLAKPTVSVVGVTRAEADLSGVELQLERLHNKTVDVALKGAAETLAEVKALDVELGRMDDAGKKAGVSVGGMAAPLDALASPMGGLIVAGAALSPIIVTSAIGLAGFGAAAVSAARPILAASQAAGGLKANLATLNPQQQQVAHGLLDLQRDYNSFAKSMQPEVFSAFNSGLGIAKTLLKDAAPVAQSAGKGLDKVLADLNGDLNSGEWKQFFGWMAQNAGPDVEMVGKAFTSLLNVLPPLLEDLQPVGAELLNIVGKGAQGISIVTKIIDDVKASEQKDSSNDSIFAKFQQGVSWIVDHAPQGHKSISDLVAGWLHADSAAGKAGDSAKKYGVAVKQAEPSTTNLAADVAVLASRTATAAQQTTALTNAWNILVGNFASKETAILNADSAVKSYTDDVKQSGAKSLVAKQQFEAVVTSIGQMVTTMQKVHAPASEIYKDLQNQISALEKSGPLNNEEKKQLDGIRQVADAVAHSTDGWTNSTKKAAQALEHSLLPDLSKMHADTPRVRGDIDNLTTSIVNTGNKSTATKSARATLIKDLENAGVSAKVAKAFVDSLEKSIGNLKGKKVGVTLDASGNVVVTGSDGKKYHISAGAYYSPHAAGGIITDGTPYAGNQGDDVLISAKRGEAIVPVHKVPMLSPALKAAGIPGFASGGMVGFPQQVSNTFTDKVGEAWGSAVATAAKAAVAAAKAQAAADAAKAANNSSHVSGSGPVGGDAGANKALARKMFPWPASMFPSYDYLEMREAGYNRFARNPSSGAYGIPQALPPTKMPYAAQAGGGSHAGPQLSWMFSYIRGRYGNPVNAAAHERSQNWYAAGGATSAGWATVGEQGRELVKVPGGSTVYPHGATEQMLAGAAGPAVVRLEVSAAGSTAFEQFMLKALREWVRVKGGVGPDSVQKAFGRG